MKLIVQGRRGKVLRTEARVAQQSALWLQFLVAQAAFTAYVLGLWRLGADLAMTGQFFINEGLFSHFQVWFAIGVALHGLAVVVQRAVSAER